MLTSTDLISINMGEVLRSVHERGPQTRASLAAQLGQSRSASGDITKGLAELGLVTIGELQQTGRVGRPSVHVTVGSSGPVVICLDFRMSVTPQCREVCYAALGLGGTVVARGRQSDAPALDTEHIVALIAHIEQSLPSRTYLAGVTLTGHVPETAPRSFEVGNRRQGFRELQADVRQDVELAAWGELTRGTGTGTDSLLALGGRPTFDFYLANRSTRTGVAGRAARLVRAEVEPSPRHPPAAHPYACDSTASRAISDVLAALLNPGMIVLDSDHDAAQPNQDRPQAGTHSRHDLVRAGILARSHGAAEVFFRPWFDDPVRAEARHRPQGAESSG